MLPNKKEYHINVGPFNFSVISNISTVHEYLNSHYSQYLLDMANSRFIDYHVEVNHGAWYRQLYRPQAIFKFNQHIPFKPLPADQAHAFLEWGMNWVIASQANHFFMLHAAVVEKDGKGIIISAPSGSGKSTLCAYLVSQGWRLLSDEIALIDPETMLLYGLGRPINLKNKSIQLMQRYYPREHFSSIASDTHKGSVSLLRPKADHIQPLNIPVAARHVIFVNYNPSEECYAEPVDKALALTEIVKNSFNFSLFGTDGFECARKLVAQTNISYIEYNNFSACEQFLLDEINKET